MSKSKLNKGLSDYVQVRKDDTLRRIDDAIVYLRSKGVNVTKTNIASEIGMHRNTMHLDYVRIHLLQYPEFNPNIEIQEPKVIPTEEYELKIALLEEKLFKTQRTKENFASKNVRLRLENKEILDKYKRLLGRYQIEVSKKVIPF